MLLFGCPSAHGLCRLTDCTKKDVTSYQFCLVQAQNAASLLTPYTTQVICKSTQLLCHRRIGLWKKPCKLH